MHTADDIVIVLSERVLQHALAAYAAQNFTHRVFPYPDIGVTLLGGDLGLRLGNDSAEVCLEVHGVLELRIAKLTLPPKRETFQLNLSASFGVTQGELYIQVSDGNIRTGARGIMEKAVNEALRLLVRQVFAQPLIRLPIQLDVATSGGDSTDESCLNIERIDIQAGAVRVALSLSHETVAAPGGYPLPDQAARRSRGKAIALIRRGIAARSAGRGELAAALFCRAVLQADPSFAVGWVWLAVAVGTAGERRYCLERALAIDPAYSSVGEALAHLAHVPAVSPRASDYPLAL